MHLELFFVVIKCKMKHMLFCILLYVLYVLLHVVIVLCSAVSNLLQIHSFCIYNQRCYFMNLQISFLLDTLNFFHLLIHSLMYLQGGS